MLPFPAKAAGPRWQARVADLRPMLAVVAEEPTHARLLDRDDLVFEPKYDGIRALIEVAPPPSDDPQQAPAIRIWSRLGNDKTAQFPEVVDGLAALARTLTAPLVLDGEIVAIDAGGGALSFQHLQGRMHLRGRSRATLPRTDAAFIAFDLLRDGNIDLRSMPFTDRRARLTHYLSPASVRGPAVRLIHSQVGGGTHLRDEGVANDWEGVVAKEPRSRYLTGKRHPGWLKIKFVKRQEFVVGGWTDGRLSRHHFGALLVGYYRPPANGLVYAGHVGSGFDDAELEAIGDHLREIECEASPFTTPPPANEQTHWVHPTLVIDVKFTQWTADDVLRNPVYLGVRTDKDAADVRREDQGSARQRRTAKRTAPAEERPDTPPRAPRGKRPTAKRPSRPAASPKAARPTRAHIPDLAPEIDALCDQLDLLEASRKRSILTLPDGARVEVGNLHKVFWPEPQLTKGDLLRFNLRISPYVLPVVADRPLVMKRFPNGVDGKSFYQHRSPDQLPEGIRVAVVRESPEREDTGVPYLIGGSLQTLAYMAQLAVLSQDPWFSRLPDIENADLVALDLDPMPDAPFSRVIEVARWLHDELTALGTPCFAKTSGSSGIHIFIPLPPGTPYEAGMIFCQILATIVASRHPKAATVERMVKKRPTDVIYIDYLQNIYGKTLACAYSARASRFAGVSTPLTWDEVHDGLKSGLAPQDFTMRTIFDRLAKVGDLWAELRNGQTADLRAVLQLNVPG